MKLCKLLTVNNNQAGLTLIELMLGLAVSGLIAGSITTTLFQMTVVTNSNTDYATSVNQVQNAGYWISHDVQMAQIAATEDDADTVETEILTTNWVGWQRVDAQGNQYNDSYVIRYTYDNGNLWRRQKITVKKYDSSGSLIETTESLNSAIVAQQISNISITSIAGQKLTLTITASVGEVEKQRTYVITLRPASV